MKLKTLLIAILFFSFSMKSQEKLPYYEIPKMEENYSAQNTVARMIDGLGFRYYWATEGLTPKDLAFKPSVEARTTLETINHILGLSKVILNAVLKIPNHPKQRKITFAEKRKITLENLQKASKILKESKDISQFKIIFGTKEYPFWNVINGPITDAIWHTGQVVSFRRSSGNPFPKGVSVLTGKKN